MGAAPLGGGVATYQLVAPTDIGAWSHWLHGGLAGGLFDLHGAWAVLTTSASASPFLVAALITALLGRVTHPQRRAPLPT